MAQSGRDLKYHLLPIPLPWQVSPHQVRLPTASSNLALSISRDGTLLSVPRQAFGPRLPISLLILLCVQWGAVNKNLCVLLWVHVLRCGSRTLHVSPRPSAAPAAVWVLETWGMGQAEVHVSVAAQDKGSLCWS